MASRMASLASVDQQMELRGPGSKVKEIIKTIDNLPSSQELTTVVSWKGVFAITMVDCVRL